MSDQLRHFREIWLADFEYCQPDGDLPEPHCMVAREYRSGRLIRLWADDLARRGCPPFSVGPDTLLVAYFVSAELSCFLSLGWPLPVRILDLFAEFRCLTNGRYIPCGNGLLGALTYLGLDAMSAAEKSEMRALAMRGGPYTAAERQALLEYCQQDVDPLVPFLQRLLPRIDLPRALLRGRYLAALARMERNGIPIDTVTLDRLRRNWGRIKTSMIRAVDESYGCFVPTGRRLSETVRDAANAAEVDPVHLDDAARYLHGERLPEQRERVMAIREARQVTGLTPRRIARWENSGYDYSTWPGLDLTARELAGQYPALGIGAGFEMETGYDDTDYAAALWDLLREPERLPKRDDDDLLHDAVNMVEQCDPADRPVYPLSFSERYFAEWLIRTGTPWPRLASGRLSLDDDTFKDMARMFPAVGPLRELLVTLGQMRLESLAVGPDGRNRCLLSPFASVTGRNQPSNSRFIFGPSVWLRHLIRPEPGMALAYVDWSGQEYGIAAYLSGDPAMQDDYQSGDPYLGFGKRVGLVPSDATKKTHPVERERFKVALGLGALYGAGAARVAATVGILECEALDLLKLHRRAYKRFWGWSDAAVDFAALGGRLHTAFGWTVHLGEKIKPRSLRNYPMQGNGAEMMRLACCLATERGIRVCCPVHDALLVEGPADDIEGVVAATQAAMREASRLVLGGPELRTEATIVRWPDRYSDPRGVSMWETVARLMGDGSDRTTPLGRSDTPVPSFSTLSFL